MSFPRYPNYKDSGVEWLGEVPEHWDVTRIKNLSSRISSGKTPLGGSEVYVDEGVTFLRSQNVYDEGLRLDDVVFITEAVDEAMSVSRVIPGDILLNITGASIGRSCVLPKDFQTANVNQHVCVIRLKISSHVPFTGWLFKSATIKDQIDEAQNGAAREGLNFVQIGKMCAPLPTLAEQQKIAAFLDCETAKIDELIAEQRRLIELLKEKRQAVISHAVTKGLNPDVPMKPSGIEWLGDVPEHWECATLTRIADRIVVGIAEAATHAYADQGTPILRSTNIRAGRIIGDILYIDPTFSDDRGTKQLRAGDLVTVRTGNAGVTAVIPQEFDGCQCFTMLISTLDEASNAEFYCYWMNSISAQCYFSVEGWGTAQVNISVPILKTLPIPVPPTHEQVGIVKMLAYETTKLDALIAEAERGIELLQERRTALISAAVTGKIDVRNFVSKEVVA